jgi:hypothetical protein
MPVSVTVMLRSLNRLLAATIILSMVGCAMPSRSVDQSSGDHHIIRLAPSGQAGTSLAHPYRVEAETMATLLAALRYTEGGRLQSGGRQPVFSAEEIDALAPRLSETLANARPDQRVDFVSFGHIGMGIGNMRKTEGSVFADSQGQLNIAFAGIRHLMTVDDDFTRFRDFSLGDPLAVDRSTVRLDMNDSAFSRKQRDDGSPWPMWVKGSPDRTVPIAKHREAGPARSDPPPRPAAPVAHPESPTDLPATQQAVRDQLAFLKELYDEGLITEEDYRRERERVLHQLP